jgi:hypothetical protein
MEHNKDISAFFGAILHSRDIAHLAHLNTKSFASHNALDGYYNGIIPLIDDLIECYQGCYGLLTITIPASRTFDNMEEYFMDLKEFIITEKDLYLHESYMLNIVDEITALISKTLYKLKYLK